jgi:N-acetylmuramic acid-specific PTS system IIC component
MFGIILSCTAAIQIEKFFSKYITGSASFAFVPILVVLCILFLDFILIIPLSGYIIVGLTFVFQHISQGPGAPFGDMLLTFVFLFCLTLGIHTAFIPIYVMLLNPNNGGLNTIFPLLGMGSGGQIGTAIALFIIAKQHSKYREQVKPWIISGILGIDEPLLYGNNIPRIVPLFTASIGAATGGFFIGMMNAWFHIPMGVAQPFGVNGVWGLITVNGGENGNM